MLKINLTQIFYIANGAFLLLESYELTATKFLKHSRREVYVK